MKPENVIDDAMIARFRATPGVMAAHLSDDRVREILRVTLTPAPAEPEIPVGLEMERAGNAAMEDWRLGPSDPVKIYRAMEGERRRLADRETVFRPGAFYTAAEVRGFATRGHYRQYDAYGNTHMHRRWNDPK